MKKITCLLLAFIAIHCSAQNTTFLQASIGAGSSNDAFETSSSGWYYGDFAAHRLPAYNAAASIGKRFHKWEVSAGISLLTTGYKESYIAGDFVPDYISETSHFYHLMVPVTVARNLKIGDRFFFRPTVGIAASYDLIDFKRTTSIATSGGPANTESSTSEAESLWGIAKATFGYRLNSRLSVIAGPEGHYMFASLSNTSYDGRSQNFTYTFNTGIVADIHKAKH